MLSAAAVFLYIQASASMAAAGEVSTCCIAHLSANHTLPAVASCSVRHLLPPVGTATRWFVQISISTILSSR